MAQKRKKKKISKKTPVSRDSKNRKNLIWGLAFAFVIIIAGVAVLKIAHNDNDGTNSQTSPESSKMMHVPMFHKEGELVFLNENGDDIIEIDIEIAETFRDRQMGLMHRTTMPDTVGMLFIFEREERQYFWMKDTFIPLDIIFADENRNIITIQKYTIPFSEETIPSYYGAKYVIEVVAGFCDKHGVVVGDNFRFSRD